MVVERVFLVERDIEIRTYEEFVKLLNKFVEKAGAIIDKKINAVLLMLLSEPKIAKEIKLVYEAPMRIPDIYCRRCGRPIIFLHTDSVGKYPERAYETIKKAVEEHKWFECSR